LALKKAQKIALFYLAALSLIGYGFAIGQFHVFPYFLLKPVYVFLQGHPEEETSLTDKLLNDANLRPARFLDKYTASRTRVYTEQTVPMANNRREKASVYLTKTADIGFRVIYGAFDFIDGIAGAILIDQKGNLIHRWLVNEKDLPWELNAAELNNFPLGFTIFSDGSIIGLFNYGAAIQRIDWCSERMWATKGNFHHSVQYDGKGALWAVGPGENNGISKFNVYTGELLKTITFAEIMEANPDTDLLSIRQRVTSEKMRWWKDPWHPNDVEPLTPVMANAFPQFNEGDLLISLRALNLIFILRPETRNILWWRSGFMRRQHDPDWQLDGSITVFDNNRKRGHSSIKKIDPTTYNFETMTINFKEGFYSRSSGNHQVLPSGNVLVASTHEGRAVEITPEGKVAFEFVNHYRKQTKEVLAVSNVVFLQPDFFDFEEFPSCGI